MNNKPLTRRQAEVPEFIKAFVAKNGYPPTVREIAEHMGLKASSTAFPVYPAARSKGVRDQRSRPPYASCCPG
ncbi:LexA repressor [Paenibacillus phoenicis]|uniref:LexA repressor n=1 Tax=Paenibacillus phoenicis TaxID=554117 RepID=A0ABU5PKJ0_9BACL|nr:LexA repressor [Paenibacillus phoenicis]MEA3570202.1 LexA repressor [Paenibacillus phoenicis]